MRLLVAMACALLCPVTLETCVDSAAPDWFVTKTIPAQFQTRFANGKLGILRQSFDPLHFITAYRILSGKPFSNEQIKALYRPPEPRPEFFSQSFAAEQWRTARTSVAPDSTYELPSDYKTIEPGYYFLNCNEHAFLTAANTLNALRDQWGRQDERFVAWVLAQDMVFGNCSTTTPRIPAPPASKTEPLAAAHRRYQIAAAQFYAGQYRQAASSFRAISQDPHSPWRSIAPYLAARALMRAGQFHPDPAAYREAIASFESVLSDPARKQWHPSSRGLLARLKLRVDPDQRLAELGQALLSEDAENIRQNAIDLVFLAEKQDYIPQAEMGAWVGAMSGSWSTNHPGRVSRTIELWRKHRSAAWLIAGLIRARAPRDIDELLRAASRHANPQSAAFESICYYAALHEVERQRWESARRWCDRGLGKPGLDVSSRNSFLAVRMKAAGTWDDFLNAALRRTELEFDGPGGKELTKPRARRLPGGAVYGFDEDAVQAFNRSIPLRLWIDAASHPALPPAIQLRIAQSAWFRAVMLERHAEAKQLMRRIVALNPAANRQYLDAEDPPSLRFAAVYTYLRAPSLSPFLQPAPLETSNLAKPHVSRACPELATDKLRPPFFLPFLSRDERRTAQQELLLLEQAPKWHATFALREAIAWAKLHPGDPRTPEALHRAVRMSYYGCRDKETGKHSQEAFDILHRQYAATIWAAQTKHWYR